jgi:hypothetical protein
VAWREDNNATEVFFGCINPPVERCGGATISGGVLRQVWYVLGYTLRLSNVVAAVGEPDFVSHVPEPAENGCRTALYWVEEQTSAYSYESGQCPTLQELLEGFQVSPSLEVGILTYGLVQEAWPEIDAGGPYYKWSGFGEQ